MSALGGKRSRKVNLRQALPHTDRDVTLRSISSATAFLCRVTGRPWGGSIRGHDQGRPSRTGRAASIRSKPAFFPARRWVLSAGHELSISAAQAQQQPIFNLPPRGLRAPRGAPRASISFAPASLRAGNRSEGHRLRFAFIPGADQRSGDVRRATPGGNAAAVWSFLTYALFHADWAHLIINSLWLAAFGSPLAWRFGTGRFLLFSAVGAVCGAALYLVTNLDRRFSR